MGQQDDRSPSNLPSVPFQARVMGAQGGQAMITGRSRRGGEHPPATLIFQADAIELTCDRLLRLRAGESYLTLLPDGQIHIEGRVLTQVAQGNRSF